MAGQQYRPVTIRETSSNDAMGIRAARVQADNLDNLHDHVLPWKIVCNVGNPHVQSPNNTTDEHLTDYLGKHFIPDGLPNLRYWANTKRTAGAGNITWKIVVDDGWLYTADEDYDSTAFVNAKTTTFATSSDSHAIATGTLDVSQLAGRWVWIYLTAANANAADRASLYTLELQLEAA